MAVDIRMSAIVFLVLGWTAVIYGQDDTQRQILEQLQQLGEEHQQVLGKLDQLQEMLEADDAIEHTTPTRPPLPPPTPTPIRGCRVDVQAYGGNDRQTTKQGWVKVSGRAVWESEWIGYQSNRRGVTIVTVDTRRCSSIWTGWAYFDTFARRDRAIALRNHLNDMRDGQILVGVTADEPTRHLSDALPALQALGVDVSDVQYRGAFAFVAQKGFPDKTVLRKALTEQESFEHQPHITAVIEGSLMSEMVIHVIDD